MLVNASDFKISHASCLNIFIIQVGLYCDLRVLY